MLTLIKKNAVYFGGYTLVMLSLLAVVHIIDKHPLSAPNVMFLGPWLILVVMGSISVAEGIEAKSGGYDFLRTLPIEDREIVAAKFLVVLATIAVFSSGEILLLMSQSPSPRLLTLARIILTLSVDATLILAGLAYIIIFRKGMSWFNGIIWTSVVVIFILPIVFVELFVLKKKVNFEAFFDRVINIPRIFWAGVTVVCLAGFIILMTVAFRVKKAAV